MEGPQFREMAFGGDALDRDGHGFWGRRDFFRRYFALASIFQNTLRQMQGCGYLLAAPCYLVLACQICGMRCSIDHALKVAPSMFQILFLNHSGGIYYPKIYTTHYSSLSLIAIMEGISIERACKREGVSATLKAKPQIAKEKGKKEKKLLTYSF